MFLVLLFTRNSCFKYNAECANNMEQPGIFVKKCDNESNMAIFLLSRTIIPTARYLLIIVITPDDCLTLLSNGFY